MAILNLWRMNNKRELFFSLSRKEGNFISLRASGFICITIAFCLLLSFAHTGLINSGAINVNNLSNHILPAGQIKDEWKTVGYGGGGAMFNPEVSPFNPGFAFVSCDMTGSYVTYNGGESWRTFNLHSPVDFYVFDPLDSNTVYANSLALFKSNDKGITWNLLYPSSSETIGLVSKGDHAEEVVVTRDSTIREVQALAIDPENSKKLYAVISIDTARHGRDATSGPLDLF